MSNRWSQQELDEMPEGWSIAENDAHRDHGINFNDDVWQPFLYGAKKVLRALLKTGVLFAKLVIFCLACWLVYVIGMFVQYGFLRITQHDKQVPMKQSPPAVEQKQSPVVQAVKEEEPRQTGGSFGKWNDNNTQAESDTFYDGSHFSANPPTSENLPEGTGSPFGYDHRIENPSPQYGPR